jgi:hypothetical protein
MSTSRAILTIAFKQYELSRHSTRHDSHRLALSELACERPAGKGFAHNSQLHLVDRRGSSAVRRAQRESIAASLSDAGWRIGGAVAGCLA